jgi:DNA-binding transcriptional MerR regulator
MPARAKGPGRKIFHKIGEVCELTKTEPYVLRYWESEFPFLAPEKNKAGQRIYTDEDIDTVQQIKRLLYEEGYTTAGARRKLEQSRRESEAGATPEGDPAAAPRPAPADDLRPALRHVREELRALRAELAGKRRD